MVQVFPVGAVSLDSAFGIIQGVYKTILKLIEEKKVMLGISDMGCVRAVLPAVDGTTRLD